MKYFLITNHPFQQITISSSIGVMHKKENKYWHSNFNTDPFLVKTYDFDEFIFFVDEHELDLIRPFDHVRKIKHIFVRSTNKRRTLYKLNADKNTLHNIYFVY